MPYHLEGRLLEVCDCKVLCPCWIGEDPDNGTCQGFLAWHFDRGDVGGVDVSGRTVAAMCYIPGNVLAGGWRVAMYVDDGASAKQQDALLAVYQGKLGGPVAELGKLIGEVVSVDKVPIEFTVKEGHGHLKVGSVGAAELEPYRSPSGDVTTLRDSIFSTVPGSPAYVSKASRYRAKNAMLGIDLELSGRNAIQSTFVFHA
jgi:hypothetical protein